MTRPCSFAAGFDSLESLFLEALGVWPVAVARESASAHPQATARLLAQFGIIANDGFGSEDGLHLRAVSDMRLHFGLLVARRRRA